MRKGLIVTIMLFGATAIGFSQNNEVTGWEVRNTAGWIDAVNGIRQGGNGKSHIITVTGSINIPSTKENTFSTLSGIIVTLTGTGTISTTSAALLRIGEGQTLVARDITLKVNVVVKKGGKFQMEGKAVVTGNNAGGVSVLEDGIFTMKDNTAVAGNTGYIGGVYVSGGTFTMHDSAQVSKNTSTDTDSDTMSAGGVYVDNGTFTMQDNTQVSDNTGGDSGGVSVFGNFTMQDNASVTGNTGRNSHYGKVGVAVGGNFTMQDNVKVSNNTGRGVYLVSGTFTMRDNAQVSGNTDSGVYVSGTFTMEDNASVTGNTGRGVDVGDTFKMQGGTVSTNSGGGVYVSMGGYGTAHGGIFTMQGGIISGNTSDYGGGVYVGRNGTFTKTGGIIYGSDAEGSLKNTAAYRGHAVYYEDGRWRNSGVGPTMNPDSYGFWLNETEEIEFPEDFWYTKKRRNFNNTLTFTSTTVKSSSSNYVWVIQKISDNVYTLKRTDSANTMTLTIRREGNSLIISGDSGSGENNWNGTWYRFDVSDGSFY